MKRRIDVMNVRPLNAPREAPGEVSGIETDDTVQYLTTCGKLIELPATNTVEQEYAPVRPYYEKEADRLAREQALAVSEARSAGAALVMNNGMRPGERVLDHWKNKAGESVEMTNFRVRIAPTPR